jgi:tetratricopeptide (TPR) repeat protein
VFRGGFTREAAEHVAGASLALLSMLVAKSLVQPTASERFDLHEVVRQYAEAYLENEPGAPAARPGGSSIFEARRAHAVYYLALVEKAAPELYGPQQAAWMQRLEQEHDNIRAALAWALQQDVEIALRLASALQRFWGLGHVREGSEWLNNALRTAAHNLKPISAAARAKALCAQCDLTIWLSDFTQAGLLAEEALALYRELGDRHGEAFSLFNLARARYMQADYALGQSLIMESLALYRELGDKLGAASVLRALGVAGNYENFPEARAYLEESLNIYRGVGHLAGVAGLLSDLGTRALRMGDVALARPWLEESLAIRRSLGGQGAAFDLQNLGELAFHQGDYKQARLYFEESLSLSRQTGQNLPGLWAFVRLGYVALRQRDMARASAVFLESQRQFNEAGSKIGVIFALEGVASLAVAQGQSERAVRLLGWADATRAAIDDLRPPVEQADVDRDLASVRSRLGEAVFGAAYAEGRAMSIGQAIAYALEDNTG